MLELSQTPEEYRNVSMYDINLHAHLENRLIFPAKFFSKEYYIKSYLRLDLNKNISKKVE